MEDGLEDLNVSVAGPSGENGKMIRVGRPQYYIGMHWVNSGSMHCCGFTLNALPVVEPQ